MQNEVLEAMDEELVLSVVVDFRVQREIEQRKT